MLRNMRSLRLKAGLSQQQLADVVGVSQQSINKYENHSVEPDLRTLTALADYFETSVDYLIGHTEIAHRIEPVQPFELNRQEARAVELFRALNTPERESILLVMENYCRKTE